MALPAEYSVFDHYKFNIDQPKEAFFLNSGVHTKETQGGYFVARRAPNTSLHLNAVGYFELVDHTNTVRARLDRTQYGNFLTLLGGEYSFTKSTYREVKKYQKWKDIYSVQTIKFSVLVNGHSVPSHGEGTFCRGKCGIFLPLSALSVDHQKPKKGGHTEALLRIFRGFGLTKAGPKGLKNKGARNDYMGLVGGGAFPPGDDPVMRNTLNSTGILYYSILTHFNKLNELKEICMHHYLNLRPMCVSCNSSRKNSGVIFV
jgi:archaellum component FlaF (FlaF/FlaG flagellin family)